MQTSREKLYHLAYSNLGIDVTPKDAVPDAYGCAEAVSTLLAKLVAFPIITGTYSLCDKLSWDDRFETISAEEVEAGDIIVSPTGKGNNPAIPNGHAGIVGKHWIMSNDSRTGTFEANWTREGWDRFYGLRGGYPVYYFRLK